MTLALDFVPNAVHAGIYRAIAAGYYREEGIELDIQAPSSTADAARLLAAEKVDFGLMDGLDLGNQVARGSDLRAVMAVLRRPAGGLVTLAESGIDSPAALADKTVGETGAPSDRAVFETMVGAAGGDPSASKVVSIGFGGVQALLARRIDALVGYVPADATAVGVRGYRTRNFAFDRFGGPSYPGLLVAAARGTVTGDPALVEAFVRATVRGYRDALRDPRPAIADLVRGAEGVRPGFALEAFDAYRPYIGPAEGVGRIDPAQVRALSRFMLEAGLIGRGFTPARFGSLVPPA